MYLFYEKAYFEIEVLLPLREDNANIKHHYLLLFMKHLFLTIIEFHTPLFPLKSLPSLTLVSLHIAYMP